MRRRSLATAAVASAVCVVSGCAALTLFSDTHHHTHGSPEIETRLKTLEERAAGLEARLASLEGVPLSEPLPVLPPPSP